eukprot:scaffold35457_cov62-Cyclotella_meneghiniana.AAC.1
MKLRICQPPLKQASKENDDMEDTDVYVPLIVTTGAEGDYHDRMHGFFQVLENEQEEKWLFKKVALVIGALLSALVFFNVSLMWSVKSVLQQTNLNQQATTDPIGISNNRLTDAATGEEVLTLSHGLAVTATPNPEYVKRFLQLMGKRALSFMDTSFDFHAEVRSLNEEEPVAHLEMDSAAIQDVFKGYQEGTSVTVSVDVTGVVHTGHVAPGVEFSSDEQCQVYDHVMNEVQDDTTVYQVSCCGNDPCSVKVNSDNTNQAMSWATRNKMNSQAMSQATPSFLRHSQEECIPDGDSCETDNECCEDNRVCTWYGYVCMECIPDGVSCETDDDECCEDESKCVPNGSHGYVCINQNDCFSPYSTVFEKKKGLMYMKDLSYGDQVMASGGKYKDVLFSSHSHPSKPTKYLQIYNEFSEIPLEVTANHFIFLHDKALPVLAGDIREGDILEGQEGPVKVTKIESVVREGLYSFVTSDATLFVNGVLASSMTSLDNAGEIVSFDFGLFSVHAHTFGSWIYAPMMQFGCSKIGPFYCSEVDDGSGGSMHVFAAGGKAVLEMHPFMRVVFISSWTLAGVFGILCYYLSLYVVMPAASIGLGLKSMFKSKTV